MRRSLNIVRLLTMGAFVILILNGCALFEGLFPKEKEKNPSELMSEGINNLRWGDFEGATEAFQKVKDRYPYSRFAVEAELKMADALYKGERYDEAFEAYDAFERLHPKNSNIPYAVYQKGMCYYNQVSTFDRDQSVALRAKEEFDRLVKKFPRSEYANRSRRMIRECYIGLAEYELYVGHFYYKKKEYRAAMGRYQYLIENYPDMGQYNEALLFYSKCKEKLSKDPTEPKKSFWRQLTNL
ncbi:MAG: outer membrane protein assembly factor BamD [Desulfatiglans sp.]|nr:outer membrane protein assembly factor BamD [Desulfatiglans sp.]